MFNKIFKALKHKTVNDDSSSRRRHERRACDKCVTIINGKTYPVENWSMGGVLIGADTRSFGIDGEAELLMKFKLRNEIVEVPQKGRVIRKGQNNVAFQFPDITGQIRKHLQNVVDDGLAEEFITSQQIA